MRVQPHGISPRISALDATWPQNFAVESAISRGWGGLVSTIPMERMGEPDEVVKVALFPASDDSSFVTGIELFVCGGGAQI